MSATAKMDRVEIEAGMKLEEAAAVQAPEAPVAPASRGKKGVTYKGICVFCGEKIEISVEKRDSVCFAFCNAECKARFDADMNAALD